MAKFLSILICFISHIYLGAEMPLDRLVEYDKEACLNLLHGEDLSTLWSYFLKGQATLFYPCEAEFLNSEKGWIDSQNILELGCGNGAYLYNLSNVYEDKKFVGVEKNSLFVEQASAQHGRKGISFLEGDVEIENGALINKFDAVLFRIVLQHLNNPKNCLELTHTYLKRNGFIFIIDSYDPARSSSHEIPSLEEAFRQLHENNKGARNGNRFITIEILEDLQNPHSTLSKYFEVTRTNLDITGNRIEKGFLLNGEEDRKRLFNHTLLFLAILNKENRISLNLSKAYDELQTYLKDQKFWVCPGMHFLVLKKK